MLTDQELQSLRNMGNESETAADEIARLRAELAASQAECERLRNVALHNIPHKYEGWCPDVTDWSRRDETCPACQVLGAAIAGKEEE